MDYRVLSIGTLPANPLWEERQPTRTGHATTTLIRSGDAVIVVDPGLPEPALRARLSERVRMEPKDVTHVFLTSFKPDVRAGLGLFENAEWHISEPERESVGVPLAMGLKRLAEQEAAGEADPAETARLRRSLESEVSVLQRCRAAPDELAPGISLFPLPGHTPGLTGLLLAARQTVLIVGDAVATQDHLERGMVLKPCQDAEAAKASFEEALEIADLLILGRDNLVVNPTRRPF